MADVTSLAKSAATALTSLGYQNPLAQAAVKAFQQAAGISADGVFGPGSHAAMVNVLGTANTPPAYTQAGAKLGAPSPAASPLRTANVPSVPGLKQDVARKFAAFSEKFEGAGTNYMYTDNKGLVTTGIGNLIDPIGSALGLPWKHSDGSRASQQEISDAWNTVKSAWPGVQSTAAASLTDLRLDADGMAALVNGKLASFVQTLRGTYTNFDALPAAAQLALLSLAWAWGPGFATVWDNDGVGWGAGPNLGTNFKNAINSNPPDFATASQIMQTASKHEESINSGIVPRDKANAQLFDEATAILTGKLDPTTLAWPDNVTAIATAVALSGTALMGLSMLAGLGIWFFWLRGK